MLLLRSLVALSVFVSAASGEYVQTLACDATPSRNDIYWRSLWASFAREQDGQHNVLDLKVSQEFLQQPCDAMAGNFSATMALDMLGSHQVYHDTGSSLCRSRSYGTGNDEHNGNVLVFPWSHDIGPLPAFSTFGIRLQLWSMEDEVELACLQADITPAISISAAKSLLWAPRIIFLFVLLVGILRGNHDRRQRLADDPESSDLSLPGVGDCLLYLQWAFLSGGLSLHHPGFFQPVVSKLNLFSLFTTGPLTHGRVYPSVTDGIYSINGTYGGTMGLEHMHQIVGAPSTMDTWVNMVIMILIISFAVALLLEAITLVRNSSSRRGMTTPQRSLSSKLILRIIAVLRIILSYFTLPLSALSCYQISVVTWLPRLPIWHTVSAALLITSIILAFVWMFRQLPIRTVGRLLHDRPKWYRQTHGHDVFDQDHRSERLYIALVVALTFIRGATVGGLQIYGPVQIAILALSEICLLVINRWLRVYPLFSMGNLFPAVRLTLTLLMVCFVRGVASASVSSAVGYTILATHACMLTFAILLPAICHLLAISCEPRRRSVSVDKRKLMPDHVHANSLSQTARDSISHQLANVAAHHSSIALTAQHEPNVGRRTPSDQGISQISSTLDSPASPEFPTHQYFRQPRHSSVRIVNPEEYAATAASTAPSEHVKDAISMQLGSESPPSLSHSSPSNDDWHDTRSIPLGPRWTDYTFREGDAFYSPATQAPIARDSNASYNDRIAAREPLSRAISTWSFAGIRSLWSAEAVTPQASGFQVVRPPRVLHQPDTSVSSSSRSLDLTDGRP